MIFKKQNYNIRVLQYFFFFVSIYGLAFFSWQWIALGGIAYVFLETFGGNIGLHRYFGHKSFNASKPVDKFLRFFSHYIGVGSVLSWVGQHRKHHEFSDTPNDVHSTEHQGLFTILFGVWDITIERKYLKDVIKDKRLVWWNKNYWNFHMILIVLYTLIDLLFGTHLLFALYALPNLMCLISGYVLAITTHSHGYITYDVPDKSTNSWIANIYTLGEGWHNNHHANPRKIRTGEKWWEWDLPAFIIERFLDVDRIKKQPH